MKDFVIAFISVSVGAAIGLALLVFIAIRIEAPEIEEMDRINARRNKAIEEMEALAAEEVRLMTAETKKNQRERWERLQEK
jgi:hypothetical protein